MRINRIFALLMLIVALGSVSVLAAESYDFRDGAISLTASESNELYEYNDDVTYSPAGETGYAYEQIFSDDNDSRMFSLYYVIFEENLKNDLRWSGELTEEAVEHLEHFLNDEIIISISENSDPVHIPGKMGDGWFRLKCRDCEDGDSYVYVNITKKVFRVVIFEKYEDGTVAVIPQKSVESADKIVATIDDKGDYAKTLFESCAEEISDWDPWAWDEDWEDDYWGDDSDDGLGGIMVVIVMIFVIGAFMVFSAIGGDPEGIFEDHSKQPNILKQPEKPESPELSESSKLPTEIDVLKDKAQSFRKKLEGMGAESHDRSGDKEIMTGDVDLKYLEDLKVLRKSGLITPAEYKEMVNKHKSGKAR